jgi:hypothetical protein
MTGVEAGIPELRHPKEGQQGEARRKRLSEYERVVASHETQELNVNGELTQLEEVGKNEMLLTAIRVIDRPHVCRVSACAGDRGRSMSGFVSMEGCEGVANLKVEA